MKKEYLGNTKNGFAVYVDMESSHASTHFAAHSRLQSIVKDIIPTIEATGDVMRFERDMEEVVGDTDLVETNTEDEIIYALRPKRTQYSRFVKNKASKPTSWVTLDIRKSGEGEYILHTAFVGRLTPSFPGGDYLPHKSIEFWSKHALALGTLEIVPGSETTECPW